VAADELDATDRRLLRLLKADGRRTYSEMAPEVGLSVAAVKRRVDRLRANGVITGFTVEVDHAKLGWGVEAFTEVRCAGSTSIRDIHRITGQLPEVQAVFTIAGDLDALVHMRVRDLDHLQRVVDRLRGSGMVIGTRTLMVLGSWNREDLPVGEG
jgi:DNA-binding Lrp family transcriptional regulator